MYSTEIIKYIDNIASCLPTVVKHPKCLVILPVVICSLNSIGTTSNLQIIK